MRAIFLMMNFIKSLKSDPAKTGSAGPAPTPMQEPSKYLVQYTPDLTRFWAHFFPSKFVSIYMYIYNLMTSFSCSCCAVFLNQEQLLHYFLTLDLEQALLSWSFSTAMEMKQTSVNVI